MSNDAGDLAGELQALLAFYEACGVDCALGDAPVDRFAAPAPPIAEKARVEAPPAERAPPRISTAAPAPLAPDAAIRAAAARAASSADLAELSAALKSFEGLENLVRARHFLFSRGAPGSIMAMDYAPGEAEERGGGAFCGAEARLLEAMLRAAKISLDSAYLAYFSPWRPAGGQTLAPHLSAALAPFARRHVALAKPSVLLALGDSAKFLLDTNESPGNLYGRRIDATFDGTKVAVFVAPSPSAALKSGALKRRAWQTLRRLVDADFSA